MAKQVNMSYDFVSDSVTYWTSEWSADGYKGRLNDTVYEDGASWTDWCLFVGTDEECAKFISICEEKSVKEALIWDYQIARAEARKVLGELPTL